MTTQTEIYETLPSELDPELSWTEAQLPEKQRTKHVHRLHPYLGKYVPQLVEIFLRRHFVRGMTVLDPFVGSGTTLVEASTFGAHSIGVDISAFNCLLSSAKTLPDRHDRFDHDLKEALARASSISQSTDTGQQSFEVLDAQFAVSEARASDYLATWYSSRALAELLVYRSVISDYETADLMKVVLSRAARSARMTAHHDLDFPREPVTGPYQCRKHFRICRPTDEAVKFLRRYTLDTVRRVREYHLVRKPVDATVIHGDSRTVELEVEIDGVITSPPYPGRIDYHAQHQYAYELLGLRDRREEEIGTASGGTSKRAISAYMADMAAVFRNAARHMRSGAPVVIVIDDSRDLYGTILEEAGLQLEQRHLRHVNRRTGRRQGEFFESVLVCSVG